MFSQLVKLSIFGISVFLSLVLIFTRGAYAQANPVANQKVDVVASVGAYYLNFYGYIAPYASITLVSDNNILGSITADSKGYFVLPQVFVKKNFDHFCFNAVDVKRLGESEACFKIAPVTKDSDIKDVFLPPTIGLFRTEINVNSNAVIYGYSMPGAKVTIHLNDGTVYQVTADSATGYYEVRPLLSKAGRYELFADATYQNKKSESPINRAVLTVLGLTQQIGKTIEKWWKQLLTFLYNTWPLWLILLLLLIIVILWRKLREKRVTPVVKIPAKAHSTFDFFTRERKLHHYWMEGVGY